MTEVICTWEALRTLGFDAADIFVIVVPLDNGDMGVRFALKAQGKQFTCDVGAVRDASYDDIRRSWENRADEHNKLAALDPTSPEWFKVFHSSSVWKRRMEFVMMLVAKGFRIPPGRTLN